MREKAEDIYKVYRERQGLFSQDDIDYLRPFQQSFSYPPDLQSRIDDSIAFIKKKREEELAKTRKRLRVVYGLLGGALLALIAAGYFYFNANNQKKIALEQTKLANEQTRKADSSLNNFLVAKSAKDDLEFIGLESRANTILSGGGCPESVLKQMDSILNTYKDSPLKVKLDWKNKLESVRIKSKNCK